MGKRRSARLFPTINVTGRSAKNSRAAGPSALFSLLPKTALIPNVEEALPNEILFVKSAFLLLLLLRSVATSDGCTAMLVGREASDDGSVLNSQTADGWYDSNLRVIPGGTFPEGEEIPVYFGLLGDEPIPPLYRSTVKRIRSRSSWLNFRSPIQNGGFHRIVKLHYPEDIV